MENEDFGLPPAEQEANEGTGPLDGQGFPKEYVRIKVFRRDAQALDYVTPGINGYVLKIKCDEEVIIPKVFAEVIDHCVEEVTTKSEGGLETRPVHRFPFSLLGPATEAEYLRFQAKMRDAGKNAVMQRT
jgi:hypothetical protein